MPWEDGSTTERVVTRLESVPDAIFSRAGVLQVAVGAGRYYVPRPLQILRVVAAVGTPPTGAPIICDVNVNGSTVFTNQVDRPTIAIGASKVSIPAVPALIDLAVGDLMSVDIDQVGSSVAGSDLTVIVLMMVP